jgi:hypothetical protein
MTRGGVKHPVRKGGPGRGRARPRIQPYLAPELHSRFLQYCAAKRQTESAVITAALTHYLDETRDHLLVLRRLDRLGRAEERTQRDLELVSAAFGLFLQFWFAHTPTISSDARDAARRNAASRYKQFVEHLAEQFGRGRRFIDDLPKELLADDRELEAIARAADHPAELAERRGEP